jgi:uncharacterized membrane protein YoaK (UPF0700 family)
MAASILHAPADSAFHETCAAVLLCVAAGFADAVGFVHLGVFAANMTGNTVLLGLSLAQLDGSAVVTRAATLASFFIGAGAGRLLLRSSGGRVGLGLAVEAALLAASSFVDAKNVVSLWTIAAAMGIQASTIVKFRGAAVSTVVITSTMARLAEWVCEVAMAPLSRRPAQAGTPPGLLFNTWLSYAGGALVAAFAMPMVALAMLVPAGLVLMVAWIYSAGPLGAARR